MAKRNAFTLAEVLITLGIIGVVAAMTLPTLLNSTQAAQFRSQFKKTFSVASQAVVVTLALEDYDAAQANSTGTGEDDASLYNMFHKRLNLVGMAGEGSNPASWAVSAAANSTQAAATQINNTANWTYFLNDGSVLSVEKKSGCTATSPCKGVIDVNGPKMPNKMLGCDEGASVTNGECKSTKAGDVIPIRIHDQVIETNSPAAKYIMFKGGK